MVDTILLNQIEAASGRNEKIELLKKANEYTQKALKYALDTYTTFGATVSEAVWTPIEPRDSVLITEWWDTWFATLDRLAARDLTGHAAQQAIKSCLVGAPYQDCHTWALRILHKDLRCGVSVKTLAAVFPGLIQPFAVMLASKYDPDKTDINRPGYFEPKLDGLRMTVVGGIPYTRNGNRIYNVGHIIKELTNQLLKKKSDIKNFVFDGECMGPGTFEETIGSARTQTEDNSDLRYHIFDMILIEEWNAKKTEPFLARRNRLEHYIHSKRCVTVVESIPSSTATAVTADAYLKLYVNQGYEGAMWKSASGPYEFKRSSYVLKIKSFETHDGEIIAYEKGTGKNANVLGCFTVKLEDGTQVRVGGGYTDAQRKQFWKDRTSLVGKTVEIQYQNKTAKGSLRFPVFVRFRPDKD